MFRKLRPITVTALSITLACSLFLWNTTNNNSHVYAQGTSNKTTSTSALIDTAPLSPSLQGASYLMVDVLTSDVLAEKDSTTKRFPASTTKLLTGLVAMEKLKESDVVKVGREVLVEGSGLGLQPGDQITVENLLKACYLTSANDAAAALAVKAGETMENFMYDMNKYAKDLGCTQTNFVNPHGLHDDNHYTTAEDLNKIALAFINHPTLKKYTIVPEDSIEFTRASGLEVSISVTSTNLLLGKYPGSLGLKTGTTTPAGQCLISYVSKPDGVILVTLLNSSERYTDTVTLLDKGFANLRVKKALLNSADIPERMMNSKGIY